MELFPKEEILQMPPNMETMKRFPKQESSILTGKSDSCLGNYCFESNNGKGTQSLVVYILTLTLFCPVQKPSPLQRIRKLCGKTMAHSLDLDKIRGPRTMQSNGARDPQYSTQQPSTNSGVGV